MPLFISLDLNVRVGERKKKGRKIERTRKKSFKERRKKEKKRGEKQRED